ncbi:BrnT family toxin [Schauerella aestuarii]|uniref:BrnT family toxin n=1 Tax=Schauerella aestuarii TaxID=2511204 RepID=UPI001368345A|nr:BrnT family toxin [Achromobacter aestuarii]MYZ44204.1 BrnT family toxin [Achromobacter aestuarii]
MDITFDPAKNNANAEKHGVALTDIASFEWDTAVIAADTRKQYGENRMVALGYIGDRLYYAVYVDRNDQRRIISLRKANSREVKRYAET